MKPCPFCGKPGRMVSDYRGKHGFMAVCDNYEDRCQAEGPWSEFQTMAVAGWNRRAIEDAEIARLRAACEAAITEFGEDYERCPAVMACKSALDGKGAKP